MAMGDDLHRAVTEDATAQVSKYMDAQFFIMNAHGLVETMKEELGRTLADVPVAWSFLRTSPGVRTPDADLSDTEAEAFRDGYWPMASINW